MKRLLILVMLLGTWACTLQGVREDKASVPDFPLNNGVSDASFLTTMEKAIITELNIVRSNPKQYAEFLRGLKGRSQWTNGLEEAIRFVEKVQPLPLFRASRGLSRSAQVLINDRGPDGLTGHINREGTTMIDRMNSYGHLEGKAGEYLGYGYTEAEALVARLAIDEGIEGNDGKAYLFDNNFLIVGVACGPHKTHRIMCAIDFAQSFREITSSR